MQGRKKRCVRAVKRNHINDGGNLGLEEEQKKKNPRKDGEKGTSGLVGNQKTRQCGSGPFPQQGSRHGVRQGLVGNDHTH